MSVNSFDKYIYGILPAVSPYDFSDKEKAIAQHVSYMVNRTQSMFEYENLPDTIPQRSLELYLQLNGNVCIAERDGELYAFCGGLGGEPNAYYMPTIYTVANPALKFSKMYKIGEDCVVIPNDALYIGLKPLMTRYATAIVETELSMQIAAINSRMVNFITAPDDRTKASAEKYLSDIQCGKYGVIADNAFLDGIKIAPGATSGSAEIVSKLIELNQYYKASFFNEIGLRANYNMKRESLNSAESQLDNDALIPLIDNMLYYRQQGVEEVNKMFGTNISVKLSSAWEDNAQEIELEHEEMKTENAGGVDNDGMDAPEDRGSI